MKRNHMILTTCFLTAALLLASACGVDSESSIGTASKESAAEVVSSETEQSGPAQGTVQSAIDSTEAEISDQIAALDSSLEEMFGSSEEESEESSTEEEPDPIDFDAVTEWYRENPMQIRDGVYFIGQDLAEGSYGLTCIEAPYGMEAAVFETVDDYYSYHRSDRFTVGEENDAIAAHAARDEYIYEGNTCALNLHEGNVLRIKYGIGELSFADPSIQPERSETGLGKMQNLFQGDYRIGKDLSAGTYMFTALSEYGCTVVVFASEDDRKAFEEADHFTNGEFFDDVEENAMLDSWVRPGEQFYLNLQEGQVLMLNNGDGIIQDVVMGWTMQ